MLTKNKFLNTLVLKNNLLSNEQVEMLSDSLKVFMCIVPLPI